MAKNEEVVKQTMEEKLAALQARKQELEMKKLEAEVAQLERTEQNTAEGRAKAEQILADGRSEEKIKQANCNHKKGGTGVNGFKGKGNDANYAVSKHTYPWGDIWVTCLRCGKEWKPGDPGYDEALAYPTDNVSSASSIWRIPQDRLEALRKNL